jgi:hypothetical protein
MAAFEPRAISAASLFALLVLSGCNQDAQRVSSPRGPSFTTPVVKAVSTGEATQGEARHVAINDRFMVTVPGEAIQEVYRKHLAECRRLGCEVLSTSLDQSVRGRVQASSSVRISPQAYPEFEAVLSAPPSEITTRTETAEDKTLPLLDVEKRLEAKTALRERLTAMLRQPGQASIADLAAVERQIADVQSDIEAATAQRDYLRTITETVRVDIDYFSAAAKTNRIDFSPIAEAFDNGLDTIIRSTAGVIFFVLGILPWSPVLFLAGLLIRRLFRSRKTGKATEQPERSLTDR